MLHVNQRACLFRAPDSDFLIKTHQKGKLLEVEVGLRVAGFEGRPRLPKGVERPGESAVVLLWHRFEVYGAQTRAQSCRLRPKQV